MLVRLGSKEDSERITTPKVNEPSGSSQFCDRFIISGLNEQRSFPFCDGFVISGLVENPSWSCTCTCNKYRGLACLLLSMLPI